jgi:ribonuclease Z
MLLTLSDAGIGDIALHGGKNLSHFMAATRQFVYRLEIDEKIKEMTHIPNIEQIQHSS